MVRAKHILVVEDEELLREVVAKTLERLGYRVTTAMDGRDGVEKFTENPFGFDGLVLDIEMPGLNGILAYQVMNFVHPDIPVLFWSGNLVEYLPELPTRNNVVHLTKPTSMTELVSKLKAAVA